MRRWPDFQLGPAQPSDGSDYRHGQRRNFGEAFPLLRTVARFPSWSVRGNWTPKEGARSEGSGGCWRKRWGTAPKSGAFGSGCRRCGTRDAAGGAHCVRYSYLTTTVYSYLTVGTQKSYPQNEKKPRYLDFNAFSGYRMSRAVSRPFETWAC